MDAPIRVLHVEDDPDFADLTASVLEAADQPFVVESASTASEGLDALAATDVDCVVSDFEMPGMDGVAFLEAVRADHPDLPFILFTGQGSERVASDAVEADVSGYLQKGGTEVFDLLVNRITSAVADYRLATSYREYAAIVDSLTDPVYVTDETGRFTEVNEAFLDLTGYDEATVLGSGPSLVKSAADRERVETRLGQILSADGPQEALVEVEIETADGRTVLCEDHVGAIEGPAGEFRGSAGVLHDVSDRRESERYRRELYDLLADPGLAFEQRCRQMLVLGCERLGVDDARLVRIDAGAGVHETVVAAHDTTVEGETVDLAQTYCRRVAESDDFLALEDAHDDGADDPAFERYGYACYVGATVRVDGERYGTVCFYASEPGAGGFSDAERTFVELVASGVGTEIERRRARTHRRERERTLRRMHEIVAARDQTDHERFAALLALGRETLEVDYGVLSRIRGDRYEAEVVDAAGDDIAAGDVLPLSETACGETVAERELQAAAVLADDDRFDDHPVHTVLGYDCYVGTPVYQDGEVYGTLCFLDQTGRDRPFSEWEQTVVELMSGWVSYALDERASREALTRERDRLERFAGVVSHDLRSPLAAARGRLDLARGDCESEHLDAAADVLDRAETLVDDLLTLARTGEIVTDPEPVDLAATVEECWATLASPSSTLAVETTQTVLADPDRLRQVVENLVRNAVEHGSTGNQNPQDSGDAVEHGSTGNRNSGSSGDAVEHGSTTTPDGAVRIAVGDLPDGFYVADDGPGIPADERDRVFESGYSTADGGTGFGLAVVAEIAAAHGWTVDIAESAHGGTRIEITGVERA